MNNPESGRGQGHMTYFLKFYDPALHILQRMKVETSTCIMTGDTEVAAQALVD